MLRGYFQVITDTMHWSYNHSNADDVWFGLIDKDIDKQFIWTDGTKYDFNDWLKATGQPNDEGPGQGSVYTSYKGRGQPPVYGWGDKDAKDNNFQFICKANSCEHKTGGGRVTQKSLFWESFWTC